GARTGISSRIAIVARVTRAVLPRQVLGLLNMAVPYDLGESEQAGAEAQTRAVGRIQVDRKAHPFVFDVELDDAVRHGEVLAVADGQNRKRFDLIQATGGSSNLGTCDEQ